LIFIAKSPKCASLRQRNNSHKGEHMKKLLLSAIFLLSSSLFASNYPADYCAQVARFQSDAHVLFGTVSSGCMTTKYLIGYKNGGIFGSKDSIDAVITLHCTNFGNYSIQDTQVYRIEREWNGTGLLSIPIDFRYSSCRNGLAVTSVEIAFAVKGQWDSRYGQNYKFDLQNRDDNVRQYKSSNYSYHDSVSSDIWDFVVDLMRE